MRHHADLALGVDAVFKIAKARVYLPIDRLPVASGRGSISLTRRLVDRIVPLVSVAFADSR